MGRLRAVKRLIGVVHEVDELSHPRLRQVPGQQFGLGDNNSASCSQGLAQGRIFLLQKATTFLYDLRPSLLRGDLLQERLGHLNGLIEPLLNGLVSDLRENLADATVVLGGMIPTVHAVDLLEPERNRQCGIEVLPRLNGRTGLHVNRAALRPVLHRGRMVIDAFDRERTMRHPMLTGCLGHRDVHHEHVGAL